MAPIVEPRPTRRLAILAVVAALAIATTGCGRGRGHSNPPATRSGVPSTTEAGPSTTAAAQSLSPAQARTVDELKAQVSEIRGLPWKGDLPIRILSPADLGARIRQLTLEDLAEHKDETDATEEFLKLVGLFPKNLDYVDTLDKVLSSGTLGYYDDEAKELVVGGNPDKDLGPATKSTMVHELTHALTDQHFGFGPRMTADVDAGRTEQAFALSSLAEGDAERVRELWSDKHLSARERRQVVEDSGGGDVSAFLNAPPYLLSALTFPYIQGLDFVTGLQEAGGFAAVDAAYGRPPASSEEILHPEVYAAGQQWSPPTLPDVAGAAGCENADGGNVGEFDMTELLGRYLDDGKAATAAAGWNGDSYALLRCGQRRACRPLAGRHPRRPRRAGRGAVGLGRGVERVVDATGGGRGIRRPKGAGRIIRSGDRIDLVVAADASTAERLALALPAS